MVYFLKLIYFLRTYLMSKTLQAIMPLPVIGILHLFHVLKVDNDLKLKKTVNKNLQKVLEEHKEESRKIHAQLQVLQQDKHLRLQKIFNKS